MVAVPNVTGAEVAAVLGRADDAAYVAGMASLCAANARDAAEAWTRGVGFPDDFTIDKPLRTVILNRAVRLALNYAQLVAEGRDSVTLTYGAAGQGFTLQEQKILNGYRRVTA